MNTRLISIAAVLADPFHSASPGHVCDDVSCRVGHFFAFLRHRRIQREFRDRYASTRARTSALDLSVTTAFCSVFQRSSAPEHSISSHESIKPSFKPKVPLKEEKETERSCCRGRWEGKGQAWYFTKFDRKSSQPEQSSGQWQSCRCTMVRIFWWELSCGRRIRFSRLW